MSWHEVVDVHTGLGFDLGALDDSWNDDQNTKSLYSCWVGAFSLFVLLTREGLFKGRWVPITSLCQKSSFSGASKPTHVEIRISQALLCLEIGPHQCSQSGWTQCQCFDLYTPTNGPKPRIFSPEIIQKNNTQILLERNPSQCWVLCSNLVQKSVWHKEGSWWHLLFLMPGSWHSTKHLEDRTNCWLISVLVS